MIFLLVNIDLYAVPNTQINEIDNIDSIPIILVDELPKEMETVEVQQVVLEDSNTRIVEVGVSENYGLNPIPPEDPSCPEGIQPISQEYTHPSCPEEDSIPSSTCMQNIPVPFKNTLFWPAAFSNKKKRRPMEKVPSVVSSEQWQAFYKLKEQKKREKEAAVEERKRKRAEISLQKQNEKEEKKRIRVLAAEERMKKIEEEKKRKLLGSNIKHKRLS